MNESGVNPSDPHSNDPRDAAIDKAYRETPRDAPPRALDDRVLAAAHREVAARPAPVRPDWTRRWRVPLSVAATLVVSATITLMVYESEDAPPPLAPARPQMNGAGATAPPARSPEAPATYTQPAERKRDEAAGARSDSATGDARREVAPSARLPVPFPADERAKRPTSAQEERDQAAPLAKERAPVPPASAPPRSQAVAPPPALPSATPGKLEAESAATAPAQAGAATANEDRTLSDRPAGRAAGVAPAPARAPAPAPAIRAAPAMKPAPAARPDWAPPSGRVLLLVTPEDWVAEIRWLKREGRDAEAAVWLAELKARFPAFPLPDDLR